MAMLCRDEKDAEESAAENQAMYPNNGPYRVAQMVDASVLDAALALWPRDCRLCAHFRDGLTHAAHCVSALRCEDSSAYQATQPVQFWEKRPAEPAPF
jgi:hypothetical protein